MTDIDLRDRLQQARDQLAAAEHALSASTPTPAALHTAVHGAMQISAALAALVQAVMHQAPIALDHTSGPLLEELRADLRAMHGCLITGHKLLAPARDDLQHFVTNPNTARQPDPGQR
ncbi:hypothetical protein [Amycolatopsis thermoflava]|uniref:hypothetical protein n=1 Tax=Amycolatopsis thermoflava TaxID=84480 RepID=UPI0036679EB0